MPPPSDTPSDLRKLQFDYAWKWFSFHADQRTKVFNFMLVVFGIFAAGIVNALDKNVPKVAVAILAIFAGILAETFKRLDRRNRDLVWLAEDVLKQLEREAIFDQTQNIRDHWGQQVPWSVLTRPDPPVNSPDGAPDDEYLGKHRVLLPRVASLFEALFFIAAAAILISIFWQIKIP
jgi:hypothetical protein